MLAVDGTTLYGRVWVEVGITPGWQAWQSTTISGGRSYSRSRNPGGAPKEDILAANGTSISSRVYSGGVWGSWTVYQVPDLIICPGSGIESLSQPALVYLET